MVRGTGSKKGVSLNAILIAVNFGGKVQQENIIWVLVNMWRYSGGEREREKKIYESRLQKEINTRVNTMQNESRGVKRRGDLKLLPEYSISMLN